MHWRMIFTIMPQLLTCYFRWILFCGSLELFSSLDFVKDSVQCSITRRQLMKQENEKTPAPPTCCQKSTTKRKEWKEASRMLQQVWSPGSNCTPPLVSLFDPASSSSTLFSCLQRTLLGVQCVWSGLCSFHSFVQEICK